MSGAWDGGQYDTFQGQGSGFYDPTSSPYNFGESAGAGSTQPGGYSYPNFMTPSDPYAPTDQTGKYFCIKLSTTDKKEISHTLLTISLYNSKFM